MLEPMIPATLSSAEWKLIQAIRALPESHLQQRTHEVLGALVTFIQTPRCQGMGAEGFPCGEPVSSCEECHQVWDLLEGIAQRLGKAQASA